MALLAVVHAPPLATDQCARAVVNDDDLADSHHQRVSSWAQGPDGHQHMRRMSWLVCCSSPKHPAQCPEVLAP